MIQQNADDAGMEQAISVLRTGGVIVYPTDTLYGIGTLINNSIGIDRIFQIKNMTPAPQSIIMADEQMVNEFVHVPKSMKQFLKVFPAGPFTLLLQVRRDKRNALDAGLIKEGKIGIRLPLNSFTRTLAARVGPYTTTSANIHTQAPPKTVNEIKLQGADIYINDGPCLFGKPSTILTEANEKLEVVREGAISREVLRKYLEDHIG